jgi:uncharacterized damage-inducible protein DinB
MRTEIVTFETGWAFIRGLTFEFIEAVSDDRWEFTPHERYAPFCKQVRHMVCVQGVYIAGLRDRATDFGRKHSHYTGPLDRASLVAALREKDEDLGSALREIPDEGDYTIEFYGTRTLASYLSTIPQHEGIHHGQWSFYATLGGFETPPGWKLNWGL